jgi:hypothetical protein
MRRVIGGGEEYGPPASRRHAPVLAGETPAVHIGALHRLHFRDWKH